MTSSSSLETNVALSRRCQGGQQEGHPPSHDGAGDRGKSEHKPFTGPSRSKNSPHLRETICSYSRSRVMRV